MRNEDELMIVLDIIKTYSEAAQLNGQVLDDAIKKIENVRHDIIRTSQLQAKETVKSELAEPLTEFNKQADKFWKDSVKIINALDQQVENNKWKHTFTLTISAALIFVGVFSAFFIWLPSFDEIKQRRADIEYLTPKVEELRAKYNADFQTCGGKACVRVDLEQSCWRTKGTRVTDLCILK
ncbi:hypothetical protein [Wohlfahrtiimonas chitiniclastica]|uniref:hypothetical protein n=1 Tax=Wohlfahrtiimonas chitiniclastica TaxID=400946 RepID=UPI001BCCF083|nr:hypothetical protein [Wohlfahrtiimonas chitiniclastica]MBS7819646.1 hypothetical protein [Wohlfahrtiimonas chitiniclastica]